MDNCTRCVCVALCTAHVDKIDVMLMLNTTMPLIMIAHTHFCSQLDLRTEHALFVLHHLKSDRDVAQKEGKRLQDAAVKVVGLGSVG